MHREKIEKNVISFQICIKTKIKIIFVFSHVKKNQIIYFCNSKQYILIYENDLYGELLLMLR